ncbi:hypothetical protein VNO77_15335 [Canavalia gladiata]|uniref:Uncharacterized protein n=1 Tax=Canavalia gladiata TaxID=3824 RepID=A0AAN9LYW3_CANGL
MPGGPLLGLLDISYTSTCLNFAIKFPEGEVALESELHLRSSKAPISLKLGALRVEFWPRKHPNLGIFEQLSRTSFCLECMSIASLSATGSSYGMGSAAMCFEAQPSGWGTVDSSMTSVRTPSHEPHVPGIPQARQASNMRNPKRAIKPLSHRLSRRSHEAMQKSTPHFQ